MASTNIVLSGRAFWARVYEGNHDEYGGKEFYKITVALDGQSWGKFSSSGLSLKAKPVEADGDDGITFRRDLHPKTGKDKTGKPYSLGGGAPRVVNADGDTMTDLIGNGSQVEVIVNVYTVSSGPMKGKKGHRLEAVKVTKLIPYESPVDDDEVDEAPEPEVEAPVDEPKKSSAPKKGLPF